MSLQTKASTTQTQAQKIWRKVQGAAVDAINFKVEELKLIGSLTNAKLAPSLREVTRPIFTKRDGGVASVAEGAAKARPMSPTPDEISVSLVHLQKQFAIAHLVLMISRMGGDTQVVKQFKFQLRMAIAAMADQIGDYFYAPSTGILAQTDTNLSGATTELTLDNGLNQSWITDPAYLTALFKSGSSANGADNVHVLNSGSLVTDAYGYVSAKNASTGTITITWNGSAPSSSTDNLQIVKANSLESTANDYNRAFVGLMDVIFGGSGLHGLTDADNWVAAFTDTTGGRLDGTRLEKGMDAIEDKSPYKADKVIWSKGVRRDVKAQYKASLQFQDAYAIPIDGDVKARGLEFFASKRVPPGFASAFSSKAIEKFFWKPSLDEAEGMGEGDLLEAEDYTFSVGRIDLIGNLVTNCRLGFAAWRSLDES